jgi:hypothetical protein
MGTVKPPERDRIASVELAKYLWEEFKYRHDLIWRLLFRVTAVAVVLSIAPFTIDDLTGSRVGAWVNALPALTLAVILFSWPFLILEFRLFKPINKVYVDAQDRAVGQTVRGPRWDFFRLMVYIYPAILFILALVVAIMAWSIPESEVRQAHP